MYCGLWNVLRVQSGVWATSNPIAAKQVWIEKLKGAFVLIVRYCTPGPGLRHQSTFLLSRQYNTAQVCNTQCGVQYLYFSRSAVQQCVSERAAADLFKPVWLTRLCVHASYARVV